MKDGRVAELLDVVTPDYDDRAGDWDAVRRAARGRRLRGWRLRVLLPQAQAGTCYVAAPSNTLRVR